MRVRLVCAGRASRWKSKHSGSSQPPSPPYSLPPLSIKNPALLFQLKQRAYTVCSSAAAAYADCCRGRTLSMAWACRAELRGLSACLGEQLSAFLEGRLERKEAGDGTRRAAQPHLPHSP